MGNMQCVPYIIGHLQAYYFVVLSPLKALNNALAACAF